MQGGNWQVNSLCPVRNEVAGRDGDTGVSVVLTGGTWEQREGVGD